MSPWPLLLLAPLVEVEWNVPDDCPSEAAFTEMVQEQADVWTAQDAPPVLAAEVTVVQQADARWQLTLRMLREDAEDTRTFDSTTCQEVVAAAAVVVSLRVVEWAEPTIVPEPDPPPPEPEPNPRPEAPPPIPEATLHDDAPQPAPQSRAPPRQHEPTIDLGGWVGLHGGLALGVAPGLGGAASMEGGLEAPWWRVGVGIRAMPRRFRDHPADPAVRGRFDLVTASAFGCGVPAAGPVEFPVCGRLSGGGLRGTGEGAVAQAEPAWGPWWGLGGSIGALWHVSARLAPAVSAEALAPLQGWAFSVGDVPGTLHRTGPVAFRAWAGLEIHL